MQLFKRCCKLKGQALQQTKPFTELESLEPRVLLSASVSWQPLLEPGVGGQVTSVSVSPFDSDRILMGGDLLGIGVSTDNGETWNETDGLTGGGQTVEQFTWIDANTVWAGTGRGPYQSTDGGVTWVSKRSGFPSFAGLGLTAPVQKILQDPDNGSRLLAFIGNFRRIGSSNGYTNLGEVWESTDSGENWAQKSTIASGRHIEHAVYKDNSTIYAVADGKFYRSGDDGGSWSQQGAGLTGDAKWVTVSPTNNSTVWVATSGNGIWKSTDSGASFTKTSSGLPSGGSGRAVVEVDQDTSDGRDVLYYIFANGMYRSDNGGSSWTDTIGSSLGGSAYQNNIVEKIGAFDPNDADRFFFGNNNSLWRTENNGSAWTVTTSDSLGNGFYVGTGYAGAVAEDFTFNPFNPNQSMTLALDGIKWFSDDDLQTWKFAKGGLNKGVDRFEAARDIAFTNTSGASQVIYLTQGQFGNSAKLYKTTNGGSSWSTKSLPSGTTGDIRGLHANFNSGQTNEVWIVRKDSSGNGDVYRSNSSGDSGTWTEVGANIGNAQVITTDFSASNGRTFYVGADGGVFKTTDGTNFTRVGTGGPNDALEITIDPNDPNILWVADDDTGLWRWNGSSWSQRATSNKIRDVAVDPTNSDRVLYSTDEDPFKSNTGESGVWMSETGGTSGSFAQVNQGLRNLRVQSLTFKPGTSTLIAGTNGSGYYRADVGAVYQQGSDANNLVSIEAEHFDANVGGTTDAWTIETGGSSGQHLNSGPDTGNAFNTGYTTSSPRVSYEVNFTQTGTHYIWIRGKAGGGSIGTSDSLHVGLDGAAISTADRIDGFGSSYGWSSETMDSNSRARIDIITPGVHTLDVYMREDGFDFDKIVLTTSSSYTPTGTGPAESIRSESITTPSLNVQVAGAAQTLSDFSSYSDQDLSGGFTIEDVGDTIKLTGNSWKKVALDYTVTADTVLKFDFKSTDEGEIHGIGLDNNNDFQDQKKAFQLYGTQDWAGDSFTDFNNYSGSNFTTYTIDVGSFFTGDIDFLTFINDGDTNTGDSFFRNIELFEDTSGGGVTLVDEDFDSAANGAIPAGWTRDQGGGSVGVVEFPSASDKSLKIVDTKSFDNSSAVRTFTATSGIITTEFKFRQSDQDSWTRLQMRSGGTTAVDLKTSGGNIAIEGSGGTTTNLLNYASNTWYDIRIVANTDTGTFDVFINGVSEATNVAFKNSVTSLDRFQANTGTGAVTEVWIDDLGITTVVPSLVADDFNNTTNDAIPTGWTRDQGGGSVGVVEFPSALDKSLKLTDTKSFDSVSATRAFDSTSGTVTAEFRFRQSDQDSWTRLQLRSGGTVAVDLRTSGGNIAIEGSGGTTNLLNYSSNTWYDIRIVADTVAGTFDVFINDVSEATNVAFKNSVTSLDRFHTNTGTGAVTNVWIDGLTVTG